MRQILPYAVLAAALTALPLAGCEKSQPEIAWIEIEPGLSYVDSTLGEGEAVGPDSFVLVHYTGWYEAPGDSLVKFDSSVDRGEPIAFPLGRNYVILGWEKGVPGMAVGGKRKLRISPELAYGEQGRPPLIPGNATLIFDIEIMGLPTVDVTVLEDGDGPQAEVGDRLSVHYTGWLWEDGAKLFADGRVRNRLSAAVTQPTNALAVWSGAVGRTLGRRVMNLSLIHISEPTRH